MLYIALAILSCAGIVLSIYAIVSATKRMIRKGNESAKTED
jgi:uncharacterized protein YoxC